VTDDQKSIIRATVDDELLLAALLKQSGAAAPAARPGIPRRRPDAFVPLTFAQESLWFLWRLNPSGTAYTIPAAARLCGRLDANALQTAMRHIVSRHDILRTVFRETDGQPGQVILPASDFAVNIEDLRRQSQRDQDSAAHERMRQEALKPFDLECGPLLRILLLQLGTPSGDCCDHILVLTMHHIVADAWSVEIFIRELFAAYSTARRGETPALAQLPIQYADYAVWQRRECTAERMRRQIADWIRRLGPDYTATELPADHPRSAVQTWRGALHEQALDDATSASLRKFSREEGVSLFTTLMAMFAILLGRHTGRQSIVIGTPLAGRDRREVEPLIGFFVNAVPLRLDLSGDPTFRCLLARVRDVLAAAIATQDTPFDRLVAAMQPVRDLGRNPLFQIFFNMLDVPAQIELEGLEVHTLDVSDVESKFDLTVYASDTPSGIRFTWLYNRTLYEPDTVSGWASDFDGLLRSAGDISIGATTIPGAGKGERYRADNLSLCRELEARMLQRPLLVDARVFSRTSAAGVEKLVACVVPGVLLSETALRAEIREAAGDLPCPEMILPLTALPTTSDGMPDETALRAMPVVDEAAAHRLERNLAQAQPGTDLAVVVTDAAESVTPLHVSELLPEWNVVGQSAILGRDNSPCGSSADSPRMVEGVPCKPAVLHGPSLIMPIDAPATLADVLFQAARQHADGGVIYLADGGTVFQSYAALYDEASRILSGLRQAGLSAGSFTALQLEQPRDFIPAFWACALGGLVPVPLPIAASADPEDAANRLADQTCRMLALPVALVTRGPSTWTTADDIRVCDIEALRLHPPSDHHVRVDSSATALLMATSGSTSSPKCIALTHANLLSNAAAANQATGFSSNEVSLNWLRMDHVGGLVRCCLRPVYAGAMQIHATPDAFLSQPTRWLDWIDRHRVTFAWLPNFAMALLLRQADDVRSGSWNLSCLKSMLSVAEPIAYRTARAFAELLQPHGFLPTAMHAAWGMTETSSAVVFSERYLTAVDSEAGPVEVGGPVPGLSVRVVTERDEPAKEGETGRLQIQGSMVASGYYRNDALTRDSFTADGWLRTGDLAFIRNGAMAIVGREKDIIIVNGVNRSCVEIENAAAGAAGLDPSGVAACALRGPEDDTDRVSIFIRPLAGTDVPMKDMVRGVASRITRVTGIEPDTVVPLTDRELPRTGTGKIRRFQLKQWLEDGSLDAAVRQADLLLENRRTVPDWFYTPAWQRRDDNMQGPLCQGPVLMLMDRAGLGRRVAELLKADGCPCIAVTCENADYAALLRESAAYGSLSYVLDLRHYGPDNSPPDVFREVACAAADAGELIRLIQALSFNRAGTDNMRLYVVASASQTVLSADTALCGRATAPSILHTAAHELPWLDGRHIDLEARSIEEDARHLLNEMRVLRRQSEVAFRNGLRYIAGLEKCDLRQSPASSLPAIRGGCYVLIGGLGGIGMQLASTLLSGYDARLLIVGRRSSVGDRAAGTLARLRALGGDVMYVSADAADVGQLQAAVRAAQSRWGRPLDGLFHMARATTAWPLASETQAGLEAAFRNKATVMASALELLKDTPMARLVVFSSVASLLGAPGLAAYAAANRCADALAMRARAGATPNTWCLNWSLWETEPPGPDYQMRELSSARGLLTIRPGQGLSSLLAMLSREPATTAIGLAGNNPALRRHVFAGAAPLRRAVVFCEAGGRISLPTCDLRAKDEFGTEFTAELETLAGELPRTPEGNIDRLMLTELVARDVADADEPMSDAERRLAALWEKLLGRAVIRRGANFFELGGHSLLSAQLVSRVRTAFGVELTIRDVFEAPTLEGLVHRIQAASRLEDATLPIVRNPRLERYRPSFSQERLWFLERLMPGTGVFNLSFAVRLRGALDVHALEEGLNAIVRRHDTLRTGFEDHDGQPEARVNPDARISMAIEDCSLFAPSEQAALIRAACDDEARMPFDLARPPLLRARLFTLGAREHALIATLHHIVSDGWSTGVLMRELTEFYKALRGHRTPVLPPLPVQYGDVALWQRQVLEQGSGSDVQYWKAQLAGIPATLNLPGDRPRPPARSFRGQVETLELPAELTRRLRTLCAKHGASLFMCLLAAYAALLNRYSGADDLVVGTPVAGRNRAEIEPLIGFFVNTLALRVRFPGGITFHALLDKVRQSVLDAFEHQALPFEKLVEELHPERTLSHTPLFQVMFVLQNAPAVAPDMEGLEITPLETGLPTAMFDLILSIRESADGGLRGVLNYSTDIFDAPTIRQMLRHYTTLLEAVADDPGHRLADIALVDAAERRRMLEEWNRSVPAEYAGPVHRQFEARARQQPSAVAVECGSLCITYGELEHRTRTLAIALQDADAGDGALVAICADRSADAVLAALATVRAGAAYVPLDPMLPEARLVRMLADAKPAAILVQPQFVKTVSRLLDATVCGGASRPAMLLLDAEHTSSGAPSAGTLLSDTAPEHLAYVIYTSGSTGTPKGVMVPHLAIAALVAAKIKAFTLEPGCRVLQFVSFGFDVATSDLWMTLCSGATLCIAAGEAAAGGEALATMLSERGITHAPVPAAVLAALPRIALPSLRIVMIGGEPCAADAVAFWSQGRTLFNEYGPTETTVCSTMTDRVEEGGKINIGRPIAGTRVYVLDPSGELVPAGLPGELHIGGAGVARGYLNDRAMTADRFVPDPFSEAPGARMYRTGDRACFRPDGSLEFLGRMDRQVKIRGFRIEFGDIEHALAAHPDVSECAVAVVDGVSRDKRLAAWVALKSGDGRTTASQLRGHLKFVLPDYMIPAVITVLDRLPRTATGKLDRTALPTPEFEALAAYVPPRNGLELELARIWEDLLHQSGIGMRDNFFELGGHSLLAVQLMARIHRRFSQNLPLASLFDAPTIEHQSALLRCAAPLAWASLVPIRTRGAQPPLFAMPGAGGNVIYFYELARLLGEDQPFYALQATGLDGETMPHASVGEMAAHYAAEIRKVQPIGPWHLCGHSFGAWVGYETACLLAADTPGAARLMVLDMVAPVLDLPLEADDNSDADWVEELAGVIGRMTGAQLDLPLESLRALDTTAMIALLAERLNAAQCELPGFGEKQLRGFLNVFKANQRMRYRVEQTGPVEIAVFQAADGDGMAARCDVAAVAWANLKQASDMGWQRVSHGPVTVRRVPGDHISMMTVPHAMELAAGIRDMLKAAQSGESLWKTISAGGPPS